MAVLAASCSPGGPAGGGTPREAVPLSFETLEKPTARADRSMMTLTLRPGREPDEWRHWPKSARFDARPGSVLVGQVLGSPGALLRTLDLDASTVTTVEWVVLVHAGGTARFEWRTERDDPSRPVPATNVAEVHLPPHDGVRTVRFRVDRKSGWSGRIKGIKLTPSHLAQSFRVAEVRFINEPLGIQLKRDGRDLAVQRDGVLRRVTHATALEVLQVQVPAGSRRRLELGFGPDDVAALRREALHYTVHVGESEVASGRLGSRAKAPYRAFSVDLSPFGDKIIELSMRVTPSGDDPSLGGNTGVLWGRPVLVRDASRRLPSVALVTLDTVRADAVGAYGLDALAQTPVLDALAKGGMLFEDAFSTINSTNPSHASILTGLFPKDHGVLSNTQLLPEEVVTVAEVFRDAGYRTVAAVGARHLNPRFSGFGQGFELFVPCDPVMRRAEDVHEALFPVLEDLLEGQAPVFLWVHYFDAHTPYDPPGRWKSAFEPPGDPKDPSRGPALIPGALPGRRFLEGVTDPEWPLAMYRGEMAYLDDQLGELFDLLGPEWRLAVTADHGEAMGERGVFYDHVGVFPNTLHVPLILAGPGIPGSRRSDAPVDLSALHDTLVAMGPGPAENGSRGLLGTVAEGGDRFFQHANAMAAGLRTSDGHFILHLREHNRDLDERVFRAGDWEWFDPACTTERGSQEGAAEAGDALTARVRAWLRDVQGPGTARSSGMTALEREALGNLGYVDD